MAKITTFLLFVVALIAFLHAYEARHVTKINPALEKDLGKAEAMIEKDLKAKRTRTRSELRRLVKSDLMLHQLGKAYKKDKDLAPYVKKLKRFRRQTHIKKAPQKSVSIIQSILKDLGLNGGNGKKKI